MDKCHTKVTVMRFLGILISSVIRVNNFYKYFLNPYFFIKNLDLATFECMILHSVFKGYNFCCVAFSLWSLYLGENVKSNKNCKKILKKQNTLGHEMIHKIVLDFFFFKYSEKYLWKINERLIFCSCHFVIGPLSHTKNI